MIHPLPVDSFFGSGQVHTSRTQSMALSSPMQFNEPHDELWYKSMSYDLVLIGNLHDVLNTKFEGVNASVTELDGRVAELENKAAEMETDQLTTEKELYQLRQRMNRMEATLDARGLSL